MIAVDDRTLSQGDLLSEGARRLAEAGLTGADRVAVRLADPAAWLAVFFALRDAGAAVMPIHPATPEPAARRLAKAAGCNRLLLGDGPAERLAVDMPVEAGQLLQMTSGTTGDPKCIARPFADIDAEIESYVAAFREPDAMTPVVACPTTHSYGLICGVLAGLRRGRPPIVVDAANPKYLLRRLCETERPLLYASPAVLHTLARLLPAGERLHALMTSGTLLPEPWFARIRGAAHHLFQQYGCSEAGCIAVNPDLGAAADLGFVLPHLTATAGAGADRPGEITVEGPRGPIATRDLGYVRPDGMLVFLARLDDTINVAGLNVYPKDVEDAVMAMPGVTDAVAFRRPDRFAGERVALVFSAAAPLDPQALRDWCGRHLAPHQIPAEITEVAVVPREVNGKISRRAVAARYAAPAKGLGAAS